MIRRSLMLSAAILPLASLAACGGGGGNDSATPTPTPTVSPTPTPSPTYTSFPITAATEFYTSTAATSYTGDLATGPVTLGAAGTDDRSDRVRVAVQPTPTAASTSIPVVIHENTEESRLVSANLTVAPDPTVPEYVFNAPDASATPTPGKFVTAEFLNNTVSGKITTDTALARTVVSYASWIRGDSTAGAHRITYTLWGYPTALTDVPTTGSATYTAKIAGRIIQVGAAGTGTMLRLGGTATFTVNFATGLVNATLNVTTVNGATETPYGTFTGQGAIAVGNNQFSGSFGASSPVPGTFSGSFFGSQGAELGITFSGLSDDAGAIKTRAVGVAVAKKS